MQIDIQCINLYDLKILIQELLIEIKGHHVQTWIIYHQYRLINDPTIVYLQDSCFQNDVKIFFFSDI